MNSTRSKRVKPQFTPQMALALLVVKDGADVYSYWLAKQLRAVEANFPMFVDIGQTRCSKPDPKERQAYFGARANPPGIEAAEKLAIFGIQA